MATLLLLPLSIPYYGPLYPTVNPTPSNYHWHLLFIPYLLPSIPYNYVPYFTTTFYTLLSILPLVHSTGTYSISLTTTTLYTLLPILFFLVPNLILSVLSLVPSTAISSVPYYYQHCPWYPAMVCPPYVTFSIILGAQHW